MCVTSCGQGWAQFQSSCYFWATNKKSWADAEDFCQQEGGHLASIPTEDVNNFVWEEMERQGQNHFWIGGSDLEEEGVWNWNDCSLWNFTFWEAGEPNNNNGEQHCLQHWAHHFYDAHGWDDYECETEKPFVCSKMMCSGFFTNLNCKL